MRIMIGTVLSAFLVLFGSGCNSTNSGFDEMQLMSLAAAGAGGAIAYNCTDDDDPKKQLLMAGAGAAGGFILGEFLRGSINNDKVKEFNAGYSLGTSNAAKTQYWIIQNRQREDEYFSNSSAVNYKMYSFPGSAVDPEGNKLAPHDVVIRAVDK